MNKYQKVYKYFKSYWTRVDGFVRKDYQYNLDKTFKENVDTLKELVDKATPKKVVYEKGKNIYGGFVRVCPTCKDKIIISPEAKESERYCRYCGQRFEDE